MHQPTMAHSMRVAGPLVSRSRAAVLQSAGGLLLCAIALTVGGVATWPTAVFAQSEDSVEAGKEAFRRSGRFPWYDRESDDLHRVDVEPQPNIAGQRDSSWEIGKSNTSWDFNFGMWEDTSKVITIIIYVILIALIVALLVAVVRLASQANADQNDLSVSRSSRFDAARVDDLPFQLDGEAVDLLPLAEKFRAAGEFGKAIIYLFSYQLLHLDHHRLIRLARGKTNRQYLRELRSHRELQNILSSTMIAFEDVFFGEHPLGRERFEQCWNSLSAFHQLAEPGEAG